VQGRLADVSRGRGRPQEGTAPGEDQCLRAGSEHQVSGARVVHQGAMPGNVPIGQSLSQTARGRWVAMLSGQRARVVLGDDGAGELFERG
jgi:hypothetical protein